MLSPEEKKEIINEISTEIIKSLNTSEEFKKSQCRFSTIDPERHAKQHEDFEEITDFFKRVNNIKWGLLKHVLTIMVGLLIIAILKASHSLSWLVGGD